MIINIRSPACKTVAPKESVVKLSLAWFFLHTELLVPNPPNASPSKVLVFPESKIKSIGLYFHYDGTSFTQA